MLAVFGFLGKGNIWAIIGLLNILGIWYIAERYGASHIVLREGGIHFYVGHKGYVIEYTDIVAVERQIYPKGAIAEKLTIFTTYKEISKIRVIRKRFGYNVLHASMQRYITRNLEPLDEDIGFERLKFSISQNIDALKLVGFEEAIGRKLSEL